MSSRLLDDGPQHGIVLATIDREARQMRRRYRDQPHLLANLLDSLGRACLDVDAFDRAEALLLEAAAIRSDHFGSDSLEHALSQGSLGLLYFRRGRLHEAHAALTECYRLHRDCAPGVHTDVAHAANDLAAVERALGNVDTARDLHREALALRRAAGDAVLIAESLNNLANSERDPDLAHQHLTEALRLRTEMLGSDDPLVIQTEINLGRVAIGRGDFDEACSLAGSAATKSRGLGRLGADGLAAHQARTPRSSSDIVETRVLIALAHEANDAPQAAEHELLELLATGSDGASAAPLTRLVRSQLHAFYLRRDRPADAARFAPDAR